MIINEWNALIITDFRLFITKFGFFLTSKITKFGTFLGVLSQNSESGDKKTPAKRCFHTALPESAF